MTAWSPALAQEVTRTGQFLGLDEWAGLPEDEAGELVDGQLVEEEVPDPIHGLAVSWLIALFRAWLRNRGGFVFDSDVKFAVSSTRGRKADVSIYLPGRAAPPRRGALREPPDILIEVVSPSPADERRDRVEKMGEYAQFGVSYYWVVDPALGSVEIFELDERRYARSAAITSGALSEVPGCPGMVFDVDLLWAELARLSANE